MNPRPSVREPHGHTHRHYGRQSNRINFSGRRVYELDP